MCRTKIFTEILLIVLCTVSDLIIVHIAFHSCVLCLNYVCSWYYLVDTVCCQIQAT